MNQDYDKIAEHIMKEYAPQYLKVQAIKYYREVTGVGLAEAKTAVEKIFEQYQKNGGTFPRPNTSTTAATTAFPNTSKGNAFKKDEEYYRRRTLGPVACGSLLLIGVVLFLMALVMFFIAPQKKKAEILEQVNAISEQDRERLLEKGYQEFVTDGNYVQKSTWYESPLGDMKDRLYIFQPVSGEGLCLGVLSEDKYFGYGTYCKGLAFYYKGEAPKDLMVLHREKRK